MPSLLHRVDQRELLAIFLGGAVGALLRVWLGVTFASAGKLQSSWGSWAIPAMRSAKHHGPTVRRLRWGRARRTEVPPTTVSRLASTSSIGPSPFVTG